MMAPEVSVLLPARNAAATVERAVRSILVQTFEALELIAVNDASTDGTGEVLSRLAREDARVRVVPGPGRGIVAALHAGLTACRAPLIARMDADDEALPARIERSVAALRAEPELAAVGTQVEIFREERPVSPNMQLYARWLGSLTTTEKLHRERFIESPLCHPSVTLRRSALEAVGGYREGDFPEDYALWLALADAGYAMRCLPEVLLRWRDHDVRLTRTDARYREEAFLSLKADYLAHGPVAGKRVTIWGAGKTGLPLMRALHARGVEVDRLLEVDPGKVGQRIDGVPVVDWRSVGSPHPEVHLLAAVGAKGAREEIRSALAERGWTEGVDFTCVA